MESFPGLLTGTLRPLKGTLPPLSFFQTTFTGKGCNVPAVVVNKEKNVRPAALTRHVPEQPAPPHIHPDSLPPPGTMWTPVAPKEALGTRTIRTRQNC